MKVSLVKIAFTALMVSGISAHPTKELERRDLISNIDDIFNSTIDNGEAHKDNAKSAITDIFDKINDGIKQDIDNLKEVGKSIADLIKSVVPTEDLSTPEGVQAYLGQLFENGEDLFKNSIDMVGHGLKPGSIAGNFEGFSDEINTSDNFNVKEPEGSVYPQAESEDPSFSLSEEQLRSAIQIPEEFQYGNGSKSPVILVPGTGSKGGMTYASNYAKLLKETDFADVVWLNVPGYLLDDAQNNAEYVAYAINYISGISNNKNVSIISWSQGGLDTQWALKYWASTRSKVSDFIPISPDFKGTRMVPVLCPSFPKLSCPPSVLQQEYNSTFIETLRADGGDSAYVPTTSIYSGFDEIVQPQSGKGASGLINDNRNVGVTNNEVQTICPDRPAGKYYTHEGVLYNPVGYALAVDALTHEGPGQLSRIDLDTECGRIVPDGLTYTDLLATEALIPEALVLILSYDDKTRDEPEIRSYAQ